MKFRYLFLSLACLCSPFTLADTLARVQQVEDGDTLLVKVDDRDLRIQIIGIDAPEDKANAKFNLDIKNTGLEQDQLQRLGLEATKKMQTLIPENGEVMLQGDLDKTDKYGRTPARVSTNASDDIAEQMVREGYAIPLMSPDVDPAYLRRLDRLERFARKSRNGLWGTHSETINIWYDRTR